MQPRRSRHRLCPEALSGLPNLDTPERAPTSAQRALPQLGALLGPSRAPHRLRSRLRPTPFSGRRPTLSQRSCRAGRPWVCSVYNTLMCTVFEVSCALTLIIVAGVINPLPTIRGLLHWRSQCCFDPFFPELFPPSILPPLCLYSGKPMEVLARKQVAASLAAVRTAGGGNNAPQGRLKFTFLLALDPSGGPLSQTPLDPSEVQAGRYYQWRLHKIQSALSAIGAVQPAAEANRSSSVGQHQQQRNKCEH